MYNNRMSKKEMQQEYSGYWWLVACALLSVIITASLYFHPDEIEPLEGVQLANAMDPPLLYDSALDADGVAAPAPGYQAVPDASEIVASLPDDDLGYVPTF